MSLGWSYDFYDPVLPENGLHFTLLGKEKLINPFMRVDTQTVRDHAGGKVSDVETMRAIRSEKDKFQPK